MALRGRSFRKCYIFYYLRMNCFQIPHFNQLTKFPNNRQNRFKNGKRANAKRSPVTDRLLLPSRDHRQPKSISPPSYSSGFDRREDTNHWAVKKSSKLSSFQTKIDKAPPVARPLPVRQSPNRRISSNPLTMEKMAPVFRPSQLILPPVESNRRVTSLPPIGTAKRSYHYNHKIHKSQNWESIKI